MGAPPDEGHAEVIHVGVEVPSEAELPAVHGPRNILLCPGNLYPVKGHRYLIDAVELLRKRGVECKLLVAGSGEMLPDLEAQVERLGLADAVQFLGQRSHSEILAMYREGRAGMVVLPSVDLGNNLHEGIPVALIEAMSYGIPVVGTQTGGIPELLEQGAGLMVRDKDPAALADAIERYVRDPVFAAETGRTGRQRVRESFDVAAAVSQLLERIFPRSEVRGQKGSDLFSRSLALPPPQDRPEKIDLTPFDLRTPNSPPQVTVIVPCRNEGKWIAPCLDSILSNDYPRERLEVLVVDGMSSDETRSVVEQYAAIQPCIRLLDNARQITPVALNIGIAAAQGAVIVRMDAHVNYPNDYISSLVRLLEERGRTTWAASAARCPAPKRRLPARSPSACRTLWGSATRTFASERRRSGGSIRCLSAATVKRSSIGLACSTRNWCGTRTTNSISA